MKGGGERNMTAEEKLAALPARIAQAAERAAEARRMEARALTDLNRIAGNQPRALSMAEGEKP